MIVPSHDRSLDANSNHMLYPLRAIPFEVAGVNKEISHQILHHLDRMPLLGAINL